MDKFEELQAVSWLDYITMECPEDCTTCDSLLTKERYICLKLSFDSHSFLFGLDYCPIIIYLD